MNKLMTPNLLLGAFLLTHGARDYSVQIHHNQVNFIFELENDTHNAFKLFNEDPVFKDLNSKYQELESRVKRFENR